MPIVNNQNATEHTERSHRILSQFISGPVVDKFFVIGGLAGCIGGGVIGAALWMMLHGAFPIVSQYPSLRTSHFIVEIYLFFGMFISGFLIHMGPRFLDSSQRLGAPYLCLIGLMLCGGGLVSMDGSSSLGRAALCAPFVALLLAFAQMLVATRSEARFMFGPWLCISLVSFIVAAWLPLGSPDVSIWVLWFGIVSISLATGRMFIVGALYGRKMTHRENTALLVVFLLTGALMILGQWRPAGLGAIVTLTMYLHLTRSLPLALVRRSLSNDASVLKTTFLCAYLWALAGAVYLLFVGRESLDSVIHLWAIGWITTLVIGISAQMMRALTGMYPLSKRVVITLVSVWQIVPALRGFGGGLGAGSATALAITAATILSVWSLSLLISVVRMIATRGSKPLRLQTLA